MQRFVSSQIYDPMLGSEIGSYIPTEAHDAIQFAISLIEQAMPVQVTNIEYLSDRTSEGMYIEAQLILTRVPYTGPEDYVYFDWFNDMKYEDYLDISNIDDYMQPPQNYEDDLLDEIGEVIARAIDTRIVGLEVDINVESLSKVYIGMCCLDIRYSRYFQQLFNIMITLGVPANASFVRRYIDENEYIDGSYRQERYSEIKVSFVSTATERRRILDELIEHEAQRGISLIYPSVRDNSIKFRIMESDLLSYLRSNEE